MDGTYRLIKYKDQNGNPFWELTTATGKSELQKLMASPNTRTSARKLIAQISRINLYGTTVSINTSKLRPIDSKLGLYEIKGFDGVNRELAYVISMNSTSIVLLHWFRGHQGSGSIHKEIAKTKQKVKVAKMLLTSELDNEFKTNERS